MIFRCYLIGSFIGSIIQPPVTYKYERSPIREITKSWLNAVRENFRACEKIEYLIPEDNKIFCCLVGRGGVEREPILTNKLIEPLN